MTNEIASPVSTAGFIYDHRVLYLIYKPVVYFDGSPYWDICDIYNMASRCVSAILDLNHEIAARGEAEG